MRYEKSKKERSIIAGHPCVCETRSPDEREIMMGGGWWWCVGSGSHPKKKEKKKKDDQQNTQVMRVVV
jgi:hypothetical protein